MEFTSSTTTYIEKSAAFAQPILIYFRNLVHQTCPDAEETIKWGFPHFKYKGTLLCSMAAFKQHCAIGFWKAALMSDAILMTKAQSESAMGHLGKITALKDLPPRKMLVQWIKEAMILNEQNIPLPRQKKTPTESLIIPHNFTKALKLNQKAHVHFNQLAPSHQKEYIHWITSAKKEATQIRRLEKAIALLEMGKTQQ